MILDLVMVKGKGKDAKKTGNKTKETSSFFCCRFPNSCPSKENGHFRAEIVQDKRVFSTKGHATYFPL